MSRLEEIRARWNETDKYTPSGYNDTLYRHAPADLAFLIGELERCREANIMIREQQKEDFARAEKAEAERDALKAQLEEAYRTQVRMGNEAAKQALAAIRSQGKSPQ